MTDNDENISHHIAHIIQSAPQGTHLDRPVLAAANRHGVDGMDRHARHLPLVALEGVDGGGTGNHPPTGRGPTHAANTSPGSSPVGVDLGALRRRALQLQHLLLQAGDGRPLLLEEGRARARRGRLAAGLGLTRAGIGLRQGRRRGGKVLPRAGEQILVDARVEVGPLPIGQDHGCLWQRGIWYTQLTVKVERYTLGTNVNTTYVGYARFTALLLPCRSNLEEIAPPEARCVVTDHVN